MNRGELAKDIAFARVELGMPREEFMRQTPREWHDIQTYLYQKLPEDVKKRLPTGKQQSPEDMMAVMSGFGPKQ